MSVTADMVSKLGFFKAPFEASFKAPFKATGNQSIRWFSLEDVDSILLLASIALLAIGVVMVASSSISIAERNFSNPFYYLQRQLIFVVMGVAAALMVFKIRLVQWEKSGVALLIFALFLLVLVLIPGVGKMVNGSTRWIPLGVFNLQVSELVKLFIIIYVAGYLVRHGDAVRKSLWGFLKPMLMVGIAGLLLLLEPDFGTTVVIMGTVLCMTFLSGVRFTQFFSFVFIFAGAAMVLVITNPNRMRRLIAFLNPWADPYDSGFQLTQSLIAIGTGGWFGTGLGGSVQKLFYLPEAHTDFLFAILSEELGFIGVSVVIMLFAILFYRVVKIAAQAEASGNYFAAYLAYGIGIWITAQAVINMGVNVGLLPTKGLTLPLMSYGGSSLIVCCIAIGLLMRISYETSLVTKQASRNSSRRTGKKVTDTSVRKKRSRKKSGLSASNASAQRIRATTRTPKQRALL